MNAINAITESQLWKKRLGDWVLNPYIGCEHGCFHCYCPTMPGVKFFNEGRSQDEWGKYIIVKPGFVDALKRQLKTFTPDKARRTEWGNGWLLMSFLTDCYTPAEAKHRITRQCLKLLLEAGHKVRIQTRSVLVNRDFDILSAHRDQVLLGTSLPYLDDSLARILEPHASSPSRRLRMLAVAADSGIPIYIAAAPFMPFSSTTSLMDIGNKAIQLKAREIFCEVLNPKGENLALMITALDRAGLRSQADALREYDEAIWSRHTSETLEFGRAVFGNLFIPWPDTQRRWAKHLIPGHVEWLDRFLLNKEKDGPQ